MQGYADAVPAIGNRLDLLKTLGDNTRYAIYLELARSPKPLATPEISESLGLHPNTVRTHLERMREVGLLEAQTDARGGVGRPQKLYTLAPDAPSLGLEPPVFPMLARMLLDLAGEAGLASDVVLATGTAEGRRIAHRRSFDTRPCVDAAMSMLDELGFDPTRVDTHDSTTVAFSHCPFAELAAVNPDLVCSLHHGLLEGFVSEFGGATVMEFTDLSHRTPCTAQLVATAAS